MCACADLPLKSILTIFSPLVFGIRNCLSLTESDIIATRVTRRSDPAGLVDRARCYPATGCRSLTGATKRSAESTPQNTRAINK